MYRSIEDILGSNILLFPFFIFMVYDNENQSCYTDHFIIHLIILVLKNMYKIKIYKYSSLKFYYIASMHYNTVSNHLHLLRPKLETMYIIKEKTGFEKGVKYTRNVGIQQ